MIFKGGFVPQYWSETLKRSVNIHELIDGLAQLAITRCCGSSFTLKDREHTFHECPRDREYHVTCTGQLVYKGHARRQVVAIPCLIRENKTKREWEAEIPVLPSELERNLRSMSPQQVTRHHSRVFSPALQL